MKLFKLLFIFSTLLFTSCSVVFVYANKELCIHGDNNTPTISGAELDGNKLDQKSDGNVKIPLSIP